MHSFFFAFVLLVEGAVELDEDEEAPFRLFNRFEQVSVFLSLGIEHLVGVALLLFVLLKLRLDTLLELPDVAVNILIVCAWLWLFTGFV